MHQTFLPVFPEGAKMINSEIGLKAIGNKILYFNGGMRMYKHQKDDYRSFRYITSQMIDLETVRHTEIISTFEVSKESVNRWLRIYREDGGYGFFREKKPASHGTKLTDEVLPHAQALLNSGKTIKEIGTELGIKPDTLRKAISCHRLAKPAFPPQMPGKAKTQSERSKEDSVAAMGVGCTNVGGRIEAVINKKAASPVFADNLDVGNAGVLLSLPALLGNGILSGKDILQFKEGYYSLASLLISLAFCILLRIKSIEKIGDLAPGELGKSIGLDRIPEIKTFRAKIMDLSKGGQSERWLGDLSKQWMQQNSELAGVLYIDGHEDVYYGKKNNLPRHYISRLRLAMRATTDYWVCDKLGQPFFSISKSIHGSMIGVIKEEIVPRLEKDVPNQPDETDLLDDPFLHKFMLVYDRECYSPDFMIDMWDKKIACCTYNKYVSDPWPITEFGDYEVENEYGEKETIQLAERGILLESAESEDLPEPIYVTVFDENAKGDKTKTTIKRTKKKRQLWAREVRKIRGNGNQTSIITTNYKLSLVLIGVYMFARWCQENFFKYAMEHFGLDMIISYFLTDINDTDQLVNPARRALEKQIRSKNAKLKHLEAKFGKLHYSIGLDERKFAAVSSKKAQMQEDISIYKSQVAELKARRIEIPAKINYADLPEEEKFKGVHNERKQLVDTVKLIASRSEIALASILKKHMAKPKEARALMEQFYKSSADFKVDSQKNILHVQIHHQATAREDVVLTKLCEYLNETETVFPGSDLKLQYGLI